MQNFNKNLWISLLLISVKYLKPADSFQCYECENCATIGQDDSDYIKECVAFESFTTVQEQEPEPTTTAKSTKAASTSIGLGTSSTNTASSSVGPSTSTLSTLASLKNTETTQKVEVGSTDAPTTVGSSTTEKQKVTSSWSLFPKSMDGKELGNQKPGIEDRSDEGVCYVLKFNYEGLEVTNRGCGLRGQNKDQICQILNKGEPNSECRICEGNLCNSVSRLKAGLLGFLVILFVLKELIY